MKKNLEERVIHGVLFNRETATDNWVVSEDKHSRAVKELVNLSQDDRKKVFSHFCVRCGILQTDIMCFCSKEER